MSGTRVFSVLAVLVLASSGFAKDPDMGVVTEVKESGPHGGTVLDTRKSTVEVLLDRKNDKVHVFLLKKEKAGIEPLSLTLVGDQERNQVVALEAVSATDPVPHYQGSLGTEVKPVVGLSIRFKLPGGKRADLTVPKSVKFDLERKR